MKNLVGKIVDHLEVIEYSHSKNHRNFWKCKCSCGNIVIMNECSIKNKKHKKIEGKFYELSCGHTRSKNVRDSRWTGYEEMSGQFLKRICANAKRRNLIYDLSDEYIWKLYINQNKKCALSGQEIEFSNHSASLDRINSNSSYIEGNVQWVHKIVNSMKWNFSEYEFFNWIKLINNPCVNDITVDLSERKHHPNWKGYGNIPLDYFTRYRRGAAKRKIEFNITIEFLWDLFIYQQGCCAISGVVLKIDSTSQEITASIDRIDNSKGYVEGNLQWIHKDINWRLRRDMSMTDLKNWSKIIERHQNENNQNFNN